MLDTVLFEFLKNFLVLPPIKMFRRLAALSEENKANLPAKIE
jgi:hypothetical protein